MIKTATLTWNSFYNYGTLLQAFALQKYVESLGYENLIIDDCTIVYGFQTNNTSASTFCKLYNRWIKLLKYTHSSYRSFSHFQRVYCSSLDAFKREYLKIDSDIQNVIYDKADYDVYICGSDQIWNPKSLKDEKRKFYYANFTSKKKIAYAPSIGIYEIPTEYKSIVKDLICGFSSIAIREIAGAKAIQNLFGKRVEVVVDPTLLLSKTEWNKYLRKVSKNEKYALAYILTPNDAYYSLAREYALKHGLKLYLFMLNLEDYGKADKLISGGPLDFVSYINNAEVVFTDSFHGSIFSTIFEKQFFAFKRFDSTSEFNQNSRFDTLLGILGLQDRLLTEESCIETLSVDIIDYKVVNKRLSPCILYSKNYLKQALSE